MFSCPVDIKSEIDTDSEDLSLEFDPKLCHNVPEDLAILSQVSIDLVHTKSIENINFSSPLLCSGDIDVLDGQIMSCKEYDHMPHMYEDQILTPAYFDPGTGTVTLLLPEF